MKQIEVDGISVTVEHKPRNRNSYLTIDPDGTVRLKTPYKMHLRIVMLIRNRLEWIRAKRELQQQRQRLKPEAGTTVLLDGALADVATVPALSQAIAKVKDAESIARCYSTFYKTHAKATLPALVSELSEQLKLYPSELRFRSMKRQWGNCNSKGVITLNTALVTLSPELVRYVIAHELCHLRHMNHSRAFYDLLHSFMPNGPKLRAQLRHLPYGMHVL